MKALKQFLRVLGLRIIGAFSRSIHDCETGELLGRGLIIGWGSSVHLLGYSGKPLRPKFLAQQRLTIWRQELGFTTHPRPDFQRLAETPDQISGNQRVLNVLITHRGGAALKSLYESWEGVCAPENLWIAFGGSRRDFEALDYPRKVFVDDPDLRKSDNQREKQSYTGIFNTFEEIVRVEAPDFVHLCEYDHLPLVSNLNERQVEEMIRENADVMGHMLERMDRSGHYFQLYHESDPRFMAFWQKISVREDRRAVLNMFGSGSVWGRKAFLAVASRQQEIPCYLETYLPTLAHHLGYRVRCWDESHHLISNLPSRTITVEEARRMGAWTVHPVKG